MKPPVPEGERRIALAAVAGAHGISGEVRLKLFAVDLSSLTKGATVFVGGTSRTITAIKPADKMPIARFEGVTDRSAAEALRGTLVEIDRAVLAPLDEGEYYHADIIGLPCVDITGAAQGRVVGIENYGASDLLEIERPDGKRALIPFTDPIAVLDGDHVTIDPDFLA
jgi:16S rRNA processing protein RimM